MYRPLDFVVTPKGSLAIVQETTSDGRSASIHFIGPNTYREKSAWWYEEGVLPEFIGHDEGRLTVIDSLPHVLASMTRHPFGGGQHAADAIFGNRT